MAFAILRTQKLKSHVAVMRSMKHAFRAQDTPNADPGRLKENTHIGAESVAEGMAGFAARLPPKFRKDAVQCIEYLMTGSPEGMNTKTRPEQDAYFADALAWLRTRHGNENVVYAGIHRDETTPHMYAYVVPRVGEKLNAKAFLGGSKALSEMQTEFYREVGIKHGLRRGMERSKATHKTIQQHYAEIKTAERLANAHGMITPADLKPQTLKAETLSERFRITKRTESDDMVADRLTQRVRPIIVEAGQLHAENKKLKAEVSALRKQVASLSAQLAKVVALVKSLTEHQLEKLWRFADQLRLDATQARQKTQEDDQQRPRGRRG